jgi:hypothetical protein
MSKESDRLVAFAQTCRSHASMNIPSFRRDHLQIMARMSDFEAELVQRSFSCIADSRKLIALAEVLLHRR